MVSHSWSVSASWSVSTSWVAWPSELCTMGFSDVLSACRSWFSWVVIPWCHNWFFNGGSKLTIVQTQHIKSIQKSSSKSADDQLTWHFMTWPAEPSYTLQLGWFLPTFAVEICLLAWVFPNETRRKLPHFLRGDSQKNRARKIGGFSSLPRWWPEGIKQYSISDLIKSS